MADSHALLVPKEDESQESSLVLFERLARDPNTSVEKIERLMALWERGEAKRAESAFSQAMAAAQQEMRHVAPDAFNKQTSSKYATYDALDKVLRPIYTRHGFAPSFNTADAPQPEHVRVLCDVMHVGGHVRTYQIDMPADGKGAKGGDVMTKTHATGSAVSYGMRYLLKMIFNVAVGEHDDDGNAASGREVVVPKGYPDWWLDMSALADEGLAKLQAAFQATKDKHPEFITYMHHANRQGWEGLKRKAAKVTA